MVSELMDVDTMAVLSGMERTEWQWRVFLEGVGAGDGAILDGGEGCRRLGGGGEEVVARYQMK